MNDIVLNIFSDFVCKKWHTQENFWYVNMENKPFGGDGFFDKRKTVECESLFLAFGFKDLSCSG